MQDKKHDLFELLNTHKKAIRHSFLFYRPKAKIQKLAVIEASLRYLSGKITKIDLQTALHNNPLYADAMGTSKTKTLMETVFKHGSSPRRTKEGYCRFSGVLRSKR